jgi:hypothetical protein
MYSWGVTRSSNAALTRDYLTQQAVRSGCVGPGTGCTPGMPRPSMDDERCCLVQLSLYRDEQILLRRLAAAAGGYAYSAGAAFHNLTFKVDAWCHLPKVAGPDACQAWTARTLEHLLGRARGYAASHPKGDRLPAP